jgi:hypothetical protein
MRHAVRTAAQSRHQGEITIKFGPIYIRAKNSLAIIASVVMVETMMLIEFLR